MADAIPPPPPGFQLTGSPTMAQPSPDGLIEPGNIDIHHRPVAHNPDGSISTVRSISVDEDGKSFLIPTVSPDGRVLSNKDAIDLFHRTGQHLGVFKTYQQADAYAQNLHNEQAQEYAKYEKPKGNIPPPPPGFQMVGQEQVATQEAPKSPVDPTEGLSGVDRFKAGVGKAFVDNARGLGQTVAEIGSQALKPVDVLTMLTGRPNVLGDAARGADERLKQAQTDANERDAPLMNTGAGLAGDITGNVALVAAPGGALRGAATLRGAAMSPALEAALLPTSARAAGLQGAVLGAIQPLESGQGVQDRAQNAGTGALAGLLGVGAGKVLGSGGRYAKRGLAGLLAKAMPEVDPATAQLAKRANQLGIRVTAPQVVDSRAAKVLDSVSRAAPFSGAGKVAAEQQGQFNRAVSRTFGEDTDRATPDMYTTAKKRIGQVFEDITGRTKLPLDPPLTQKLGTIATDASQIGDEATQRAVKNILNRITEQTQNGVLPGRAYQSIDSELGKLTKQGGEKAHYIGKIREALRDAMDNAISPEDRAAWQQARRQYRNLKTVRDLIAKGDNEGNIKPGLLMGRVTANNASKEAMASGRGGELGELAQIGQSFLKDSVQNSGTPERLVATSLLSGSYLANPLAPLIGIGGARATQSVLQSPELLNALLKNPQTSGTIRALLEREFGRIGAQAGQEVPQYYRQSRAAELAQP